MASTSRDPSGLGAAAVTPLAQAEHAREVVAILGCLEDRLVGDARRARADGACSPPLTDLVDELARSERRPDLDAALVAELVMLELARGLPFALRVAARGRPGWALSLHGRGGRRHRTLDLVRATHRRLGGAPRHPSAGGRRPAAR